MEINDMLVARLATIVVHAGELAEATTSSVNVATLIELQLLVNSDDVQAFIKDAGPLAPVKRP